MDREGAGEHIAPHAAGDALLDEVEVAPEVGLEDRVDVRRLYAAENGRQVHDQIGGEPLDLAAERVGVEDIDRGAIPDGDRVRVRESRHQRPSNEAAAADDDDLHITPRPMEAYSSCKSRTVCRSSRLAASMTMRRFIFATR